MVRRVIRVLELPVSLSVGVLRESASLAGRVVGRLLVGGRPSEPEPPAPPPPDPPSKPAPPRRGQRPERERGQARPKPARPAATRARKRPGAERGNGTERSETPASTADELAPPSGGERPTAEREASKPEPRQIETAATSEPEGASTEPVGEVEREPGVGTSVRAPEPHSALNTPLGEPDPTEWPDPYDKREDPRDVPPGEGMVFGDDVHPPTGATSTSEPHPNQDPEAEPWEGPKRDKVDR